MKRTTKRLGLILAVALLPAISLASPPVGAVSDGPQSWTAPPYWSRPAASPASRSGHSALVAGRRAALVTSPVPLPFVGVTPCRVIDTRLGSGFTGGYGQPSIAGGGTQRTFLISGQCGIPADAKAVSFNFAVFLPTTLGDLRVFPAGGATPLVSTLNWEPNIFALANAAVVSLGAAGDITVEVDGPGTVDIFVDINGYYSPLGVVNSLNGQAGDLALVGGANVTITSGTGTLTIDAPAAIGATGPAGATGSPGTPGATGTTGATGPAGTFDAQCLLSANDVIQLRDCLLTPPPAVAFNSIPSPTPPNVPSEGFQATQTAELGDSITLAGTFRKGVSATVLMSDWAIHSDYPAMSASGFAHPITLNLYSDAAHAAAHTPDIGTFTQNFLIPWRPAADPTCVIGGGPAPTAWRAGDGLCYNGFATPIVFNLGGLVLPNTFIYGIAFNTNTWGYNPLGVSGPYESLNVGLNGTPPIAVGTDDVTGAVYWNTLTPGNYADGGTGGVGILRPDTNWAPFTPAIKFTTVN